MKLEDIDWDKKLIVFFGDELRDWVLNIRLSTCTRTYEFPEHRTYHPWEHVEFIEYVTRVISFHEDEKFVVITNSSYILDHLTNLMKGARLNADAEYTRCKQKEAYIHKKDVGVYVCTKGTIENALPEDGEVINWDNLSEVSEWLSDIYFEMEKPALNGDDE